MAPIHIEKVSTNIITLIQHSIVQTNRSSTVIHHGIHRVPVEASINAAVATQCSAIYWRSTIVSCSSRNFLYRISLSLDVCNEECRDCCGRCWRIFLQVRGECLFLYVYTTLCAWTWWYWASEKWNDPICVYIYYRVKLIRLNSVCSITQRIRIRWFLHGTIFLCMHLQEKELSTFCVRFQKKHLPKWNWQQTNLELQSNRIQRKESWDIIHTILIGIMVCFHKHGKILGMWMLSSKQGYAHCIIYVYHYISWRVQSVHVYHTCWWIDGWVSSTGCMLNERNANHTHTLSAWQMIHLHLWWLYGILQFWELAPLRFLFPPSFLYICFCITSVARTKTTMSINRNDALEET